MGITSFQLEIFAMVHDSFALPYYPGSGWYLIVQKAETRPILNTVSIKYSDRLGVY
jgi:hypothetical protein